MRLMVIQDPEKTYQISLINNTTQFNSTIHVRRDETITEAAKEQGVELPTSCCAGACISCTGKLLKGTIEQGHCFLSRQEEEAGYILTCTAYPRSDCTIITHQEDELLEFADRI